MRWARPNCDANALCQRWSAVNGATVRCGACNAGYVGDGVDLRRYQ